MTRVALRPIAASGREPGFYYARAVVSTWDDRVRVIHQNLFEAHPLSESWHTPPPFFGEGPHKPVEVLKNVFNLAPVFPLNAAMVVNGAVRHLLEQVCTLEFREVRITRALWVPNEIGAVPSLPSPLDADDGWNTICPALEEHHACEPPREVFHQVIADQPTPPDMIEVDLAAGVPDTIHLPGTTASFSRSLLERNGFVSSYGWHLREDVFQVLRPYLYSPWIWTQKFAFPG